MPVEQITQVWPPLNEFRDMYDNSTPSDFGNPADTTQHPDPVTTSESAAAGPGSEAKHDPDSTAAKSHHDAESVHTLENFPPEIATLLIMAGVAGILLPGPVGTPLLIAGGVVIWPKTFRPIERWFRGRFPCLHREGVIQLKEFVGDLKKRFPDKS